MRAAPTRTVTLYKSNFILQYNVCLDILGKYEVSSNQGHLDI